MQGLMTKERGLTKKKVIICLAVLTVLVSGFLHMQSAVNQARVQTDIAQGRLIKQALTMYGMASGGQKPHSLDDIKPYLGEIVSAQKVDGSPITVTAENQGTPIFSIDFANGIVQVKDISTGPAKVVWSSN